MSDAEEALAFQLRAMGIPFMREYRFHADRKWRFDFAWPTTRLALEVDGGTWSGGRHVTGSGYAADIEKANAAALAGYRVLRVTPSMVESGAALALIERALR